MNRGLEKAAIWGYLIKLAILFAAPALLGAGTMLWHSRATSLWQSDVPMVSEREVAGSSRSILWVDARSSEDYERGHIEGAILLNEDDWNHLIVEFLRNWEPDRWIVVYCSDGGCLRSREVALRLQRELGEPLNISILAGGYEEWLAR